jgi:hypothetical protein
LYFLIRIKQLFDSYFAVEEDSENKLEIESPEEKTDLPIFAAPESNLQVNYKESLSEPIIVTTPQYQDPTKQNGVISIDQDTMRNKYFNNLEEKTNEEKMRTRLDKISLKKRNAVQLNFIEHVIQEEEDLTAFKAKKLRVRS